MFKKVTALLSAALLASSACAAGADTVSEYAALIDMYPEQERFDETPFAEILPAASSDLLTLEGVPSAILMEKETGKILFESDPDSKRPPASVTKVMTLLLAMEAVDDGRISLDDRVPVSRYAMEMGGSQVYMHEGETYSVREMIKSIVIASGNDAAAAMAEYLAGSEETFAGVMNERAAQLGMTNTTFKNCNGLPVEGHETTARDIAIMTRELILKHPSIREYSTIWMDTLRGGTFTLSNTNKMIRFYQGATGLKTGSTSVAKFCLSATAERGGVEYIAVILGAENSDMRFNAARKLLDYGFANYTLVNVYPDAVPLPVPVTLGVKPEVAAEIIGSERVLVDKRDAAKVERSAVSAESLNAPVLKGQKIGEVMVTLNGETLAVIPVTAAEDVARLTVWDLFRLVLETLFMK